LAAIVVLLATTLAAGAQEVAEPPDDLSPRFVCSGNEPFWSLRIDGSAAEISELGRDDGTPLSLHGALADAPYQRPPTVVWRGRADGAAGDLVAFLTERACLDTMADETEGGRFDHAVTLSLADGRLLHGCCRSTHAAAQGAHAEGSVGADVDEVTLERLSERSSQDWSQQLAVLLPAIRLCVDKTPGALVRVTKAWPMNRGTVGVRTRDAHGGWWDCIGQADGSALTVFMAVSEGAARLPGEGLTLFTLPGVPVPTGSCFRHERVLDDRGRTVGVLSHDTC